MGGSDSALTNLIALTWDKDSWSIGLVINFGFAAAFLTIVLVVLFFRSKLSGFSFAKFEIDQAELGIGDSKLSFRPNVTDRQVAYAVWVELSTRKIGLPIDLEHDVISEIYDSWYTFFSVTRELVKGIPVSKVQRASTRAIIQLSIEVLNEGLRPHLTHWQARFRHWYDRELKKYDESGGKEILDPQSIQSKFPQYEQLKEDMLRVNKSLMRYRQKMNDLIRNG
ncbi:MAG TPA: hypothetical protein VMU22_00600 [Rhizomicrobium sp.]|nr:hypothetical protein [Rhizomicrobium sp.]